MVQNNQNQLRFLILSAVFAALLIILKFPFAAIPNIEVVTPLFIVIVALFHKRITLYTLVAFLVLDGLFFQQFNPIYLGLSIVMWTIIYILAFFTGYLKQYTVQLVGLICVGFISAFVMTNVWNVYLSATGIPGIWDFYIHMNGWVFDFYHGISTAILVGVIFAALKSLFHFYKQWHIYLRNESGAGN